MRIYLRPYRTSDLGSLHLLDTLCFEPPFRFSRSAMRRFVLAKNAIVRLACEEAAPGTEERLAGFCITHLEQAGDQLTGYVVTLDVHPDFRRHAIALTLMHSVEMAVGDAGAKSMALHVWAGNEAAIRLYERLGYTFERSVESFYAPDLDALIYRKLLDSGHGDSEGGAQSSESTAGEPTTDAS